MNRIRLIAKAGIVAGAGALAAAILTPGGVGANFFDAATAEASIEVGDFGCTFTAPGSSVTFTPTNPSDPQSPVSASFDLGTIQSSAPGTDTVPVTVTNSGDMPVTMSWTAVIGRSFSNPSADLLTDKFTAVDPAALLGLAPDGNVFLPNPGESQTLDIGFNWTVLDNDDLGTAGTVTYTFTCTDALPQPGRFRLTRYQSGRAYWDGTAIVMTAAHPQNSYGKAVLVGPSAALPGEQPDASAVIAEGVSGYQVFLNLVLTNTQPVDTWSGGARSTASFVKAPGGTTWTLANAPAKAWTWDEIKQYGIDNHSVVSTVQMMATGLGKSDVTAKFTCFQYNGVVYFGTGCEAP